MKKKLAYYILNLINLNGFKGFSSPIKNLQEATMTVSSSVVSCGVPMVGLIVEDIFLKYSQSCTQHWTSGDKSPSKVVFHSLILSPMLA